MNTTPEYEHPGQPSSAPVASHQRREVTGDALYNTTRARSQRKAVIVAAIRNRLRHSGRDDGTVDDAEFDFLFTTGDAMTLSDIVNNRTLHLSTPTEIFADAFALTEPEYCDGDYFYIRRWTLNREEYMSMLAKWREDSYEPALVLDLDYCLKIHQEFVIISYIGRGSHGSPMDRMSEDLERDFGIMRRFFDAIGNKAYEPEVWEFRNARLDSTSKLLRSNREKILIATFGLRALLNRQTGGLPSYAPTASDDVALHSINTDVCNLPWSRGHLCEEIGRMWERHFHTAELLLKTKLSRAYKTMVVQQSLQNTVSGRVIEVWVGKDVTLQSVRDAIPFVNRGFEAGNLVCDILSYIEEKESGSTVIKDTVSYVPAFLDFIYCPEHYEEYDDIFIEHLREYMAITQPIVAMACGHLVYRWMRSNFSCRGGPSERYIDYIGKVSEISYVANNSQSYVLSPLLHG